MIIKDGILIESNIRQAKVFKHENFEVFYRGLIFSDQHPKETDCLISILDYFRANGSFDFKAIRGNFLIHIIDHSKTEMFTFTDNSGMFKAYIFENIVSSSFLDLVESAGLSDSHLDYKSINEFLHFGFIYFENTFMEPVKRLSCEDFISWKDGRMALQKKNIGDLYSPESTTTFEDHFHTLSDALEGKKVSVDLTGGIDSRLLGCLLTKNQLDFEVGISGIDGNMDIRIAQKISDILEKKLYITYHSMENVNDEEWLDLFNITDAQTDILSYHRNYQFNKERVLRDIDMRISGVGGELYKDFWWLQDFPFYNKKKSNINRLYDLRIESVAFPHDITGERIKPHSLTFRGEVLKRLQEFRLPTNTQTYDNIYYSYKMRTNAGTHLSIPGNHYFDCYAPLLERDLVKIGFGLKRQQRFFNNFHRQILSKHCPEAAKIKTTENISCSSKAVDMMVDIPSYALNKYQRLFKQILRKVTKKTYLQQSPNNTAIYDTVRRSDIFKEQESILKSYQILARDVNLSNVSNTMAGRFLTVGLFLERLKNTP